MSELYACPLSEHRLEEGKPCSDNIYCTYAIMRLLHGMHTLQSRTLRIQIVAHALYRCSHQSARVWYLPTEQLASTKPKCDVLRLTLFPGRMDWVCGATQPQTDACEATEVVVAAQPQALRLLPDSSRGCDASLETTQPQESEILPAGSDQIHHAVAPDPIAIILRKYSHGSGRSGSGGSVHECVGEGRPKELSSLTPAPQLLTADVEASLSVAPLTVTQPLQSLQDAGDIGNAVHVQPAPAAAEALAAAADAETGAQRSAVQLEVSVLVSMADTAGPLQPGAQAVNTTSQPLSAAVHSAAAWTASAVPTEEEHRRDQSQAPRLLTLESEQAPHHPLANSVPEQRPLQVAAELPYGDGSFAAVSDGSAHEAAPMLASQPHAVCEQSLQQQPLPLSRQNRQTETQDVDKHTPSDIAAMASARLAAGGVQRLATLFLEGSEVAALQYATCLASFGDSAVEQVQRLTQLDQEVPTVCCAALRSL